MIYLADTANVSEIRDLFSYFPFEGITTNPTIMSHDTLMSAVAHQRR